MQKLKKAKESFQRTECQVAKCSSLFVLEASGGKSLVGQQKTGSTPSASSLTTWHDGLLQKTHRPEAVSADAAFRKAMNPLDAMAHGSQYEKLWMHSSVYSSEFCHRAEHALHLPTAGTEEL